MILPNPGMNAFKGIENLKRACRKSYNFDLEGYLKLSAVGQSILIKYGKHKYLDNKLRNNLVDVLIKDMITDYDRY